MIFFNIKKKKKKKKKKEKCSTYNDSKLVKVEISSILFWVKWIPLISLC